MRHPDKEIIALVQEIEQEKRRDLNLINHTNAIGWSNLLTFLGKEGNDPIDAFKLLPFPGEVAENSNENTLITKRTAQIVMKLIRQDRLKPKTVTALSFLMDEILSLSGIKL